MPAILSRRSVLVFGVHGGACCALLSLPAFVGSGCTEQDPYQLRLPSGRWVRSGEFVAMGEARDRETPAQLFDRLTLDEHGEHTDVWALRGLVTWRVVTDAGAVIVTVGSDALPTSYELEEDTVVEFRVVELQDSMHPDGGESFEELNAGRPHGTQTVILRDHIVVTDTDDYVAEEGDFVVYVNPDSEGESA